MEKTVDPAKEIGENVTITECSQLSSITPEQAKKIKSLIIENQMLDVNFGGFLLSLNELDSLCFYKCDNLDYALSCVNHSNVLRLLDCDLTSKDVTWCLSSILCWGHVEILDLSYNNIGNYPEHFFHWLKNNLWGGLNIDKIVLTDNKFTEDDKLKYFSYFENWGYPEIIL